MLKKTYEVRNKNRSWLFFLIFLFLLFHIITKQSFINEHSLSGISSIGKYFIMRISFRIKRLRSTPPRATGWFYMRSEWNRVVFFFFFFFPATKLLHFSHHVIRTSDFIHSATLNEGNQTYIVNTRLAEKCNTNTLDFLHTSDIYRKKRKKFPSYDLDCTEKNVAVNLH